MSLIFTFISFAFIVYYIILVKKSEYISSDLKSGEICYSCKEKLEVEQDVVFQNLINNKTNYQLCQSCKRDEKLDEIVNYSRLSILNRFKLYLISEKYNRVLLSLVFLLLIFCITDIILKITFDIKWFSYFYNLFLVFYWSIIIYRHKLISTKKP
jgi:hypothetical protein